MAEDDALFNAEWPTRVEDYEIQQEIGGKWFFENIIIIIIFTREHDSSCTGSSSPCSPLASFALRMSIS